MGTGYKQIGRAFLGGSEFYSASLARVEASQAAEHYATDAPKSVGHHLLGEITQGTLSSNTIRNSVLGSGILGMSILGYGFPASQNSWLSLPAVKVATRRRNATETVVEVARTKKIFTAKRGTAEAVELFVTDGRLSHGRKEVAAATDAGTVLGVRRTNHHEPSEVSLRESSESKRVAGYRLASSATQRFSATGQKIGFFQRTAFVALVSVEVVRSARKVVKRGVAAEHSTTNAPKSVQKHETADATQVFSSSAPRLVERIIAGSAAFREAVTATRTAFYARASEATLAEKSSAFGILQRFDHVFHIIFDEIYKNALYGETPEGGTVGADSGMVVSTTSSTSEAFQDDAVASYREGYNPYLEKE